MIHPRRLKGTPGNIARYYTVGDYYTKGSDEHSEWGGRIAVELGLSGPVDPQTFQELLAGKIDDQQLGRHRANGEIEHHPRLGLRRQCAEIGIDHGAGDGRRADNRRP